MNEYIEVLNTLFSHHAAGKSDLFQVQKIASFLGDPQNAFPAIHVAGSNGKGSVCVKIAKSLQLAGYKVGLYTSPHIHSYTERIQVLGTQISEQEVVSGLHLLFSIAKQLSLHPTFFELTTLLSLLHFQKMEVDVAVIETGLGGRLDATRIVNPILSVITSISLEHTHLLGDTIEEIGREKAGICKNDIPLILGPTANLSSVLAIGENLKCPISRVPSQHGFYDVENKNIARVACNALKEKFPGLTEDLIEMALLEVPSSRFEQVGSFIFDVAHNPEAFARLFTEVKSRYPKSCIRSVIGLSSDKDIKSCLRIAARYTDHITLVQAQGSRSAKARDMARLLDELAYSSYQVAESISAAVQAAEYEEGIIVVCGSFYIMDEAKAALLINR
jgi:dihydrofolate synthase / folylpolyglutamate synthase